MAAQGYIYCLGGGGAWYYSPLSSSGVGAWTATTTSYPQTQASPACAPSGDYIYCIGGADYYAPILSSGRGLGAWTSIASYPLPHVGGVSCVIAGTSLYCIGGNDAIISGYSLDVVYYAQLLSPSQGGGVSAWTITSNYLNGYPLGIRDESCVSSEGYLYCVGGIDYSSDSTSGVYYTSISAQTPSTSQLHVNARTTGALYSSPLSGYYVLLYDEAGNLVSTGFTPVTFTVNSGQTYTIQADDYGDCHFVWWSYLNNNAASDTIALAGANVTMTAIYGCYGNTSGLTVDSVDQNGNAIFGYYSVLYDANGIPVETGLTSAGPALAGFTTQTFQTSAGQGYSLQVESYGRCTFSHWSDGVTRDPRPFTATSNETAFTAVYNCLGGPSSSVTINSVDQHGNLISGYYGVLYDSNGDTMATGFTPVIFSATTATAGYTYIVQAESYGACTFSHWADGVASSQRWFTATGGPISFDAVYNCDTPST